MNLIWKEQIDFLNEQVGISIPENSCFMDRMNIKVLDKQNKWHIIYKIKAENMQLKLKKDNSDILSKIDFLTWDDILEKNKDRLNKLELDSINIIKIYIDKYKDYHIVCPVSGGKDSSVTEYLLSQCTTDYNIVFSNTTNETHHTYKYVKQQYPNAITITPSEGFYPMIKRMGYVPTRFSRGCCTNQKEMPMIKQLDSDKKTLLFMGMRKAESHRRSQYTIEWQNEKWNKDNWRGILPILEWMDLDVLLYMLYRNIPFNLLYKYGYGRVGCTNCPFRSDYELILNNHFLPIYHRRWQRLLEEDFIKNGKATVLNCTLEEYLNGAWKAGIYRDEATDEVITEFAEQKNMPYEMALKYFDKKCNDCGGKIKKDEIALSMKFFGRHIENMFCLDCMSKKLNKPKKYLKERIKDFKNQGCNLF